MKHTHAGPGKGVNRTSPGHQKQMERQREQNKLRAELAKNALKRHRGEIERRV
jgi:hypothetical protein